MMVESVPREADIQAATSISVLVSWFAGKFLPTFLPYFLVIIV